VSVYSDIVNAMHDYESYSSGAGALSVVKAVTLYTSSGAEAITLADAQVGQLKFIVMVADSGVGTLTPTNLNGYTTIAFDDVGDWVILKFNGLEWEVKASRGVTLA